MAAAVPDPSPGMSCVLFLEEEQLGGRVLLPGFYAKQLESHAAHHMFGVELQDVQECTLSSWNVIAKKYQMAPPHRNPPAPNLTPPV